MAVEHVQIGPLELERMVDTVNVDNTPRSGYSNYQPQQEVSTVAAAGDVFLVEIDCCGSAHTMALRNFEVEHVQIGPLELERMVDTVNVDNTPRSGYSNYQPQQEVSTVAAAGDVFLVEIDCCGSAHTMALRNFEVAFVELVIARNVSLEATSFGSVVLHGQPAKRVIRITDGEVSLTGLNITGGSPTDWGGGGVLVQGGAVAICLCYVYDNSAPYGGNFALRGTGYSGGGIRVDDGSLDVRDCHVFRNSAFGVGAGVLIFKASTVSIAPLSATPSAGWSSSTHLASSMSITAAALATLTDAAEPTVTSGAVDNTWSTAASLLSTAIALEASITDVAAATPNAATSLSLVPTPSLAPAPSLDSAAHAADTANLSCTPIRAPPLPPPASTTIAATLTPPSQPPPPSPPHALQVCTCDAADVVNTGQSFTLTTPLINHTLDVPQRAACVIVGFDVLPSWLTLSPFTASPWCISDVRMDDVSLGGTPIVLERATQIPFYACLASDHYQRSDCHLVKESFTWHVNESAPMHALQLCTCTGRGATTSDPLDTYLGVYRFAAGFQPAVPSTCRTIHTPSTPPIELALAASSADDWCLKEVNLDGIAVGWTLSLPLVLQSLPTASATCEGVACLAREAAAWNVSSPASNCTVQPCAHGGSCTADSVCECDNDAWTGRFCEERACRGGCSGNGVCYAGSCACFAGWVDSDGNGDDCDQGTFPPVFQDSLREEVEVDEGEHWELPLTTKSGTPPITFFLSRGLQTERGLELVNGSTLVWKSTVANDNPYSVLVGAINAFGSDTLLLSLRVRKSYTTRVRIEGPRRYAAGTQSIRLLGNSSKPRTTVVLWLRLRGVVRTWRVSANQSGRFNTTFTLTNSEAGRYAVGSAHPLADISLDSLAEDHFDVFGWRFALPFGSHTPSPWIGDEPVWFNDSVLIQNSGDNVLRNISLASVSAVEGIYARVMPKEVATVPPLGAIPLSLAVGAANLALDGTIQQIKVVYRSAEGVEHALRVYVSPRAPYPSLQAARLQSTVVRGLPSTLAVAIRNAGNIESGTQTYVITPSNLEWLSLVSPAHLGSIAEGASAVFTLALNPPSDVLLGPYTGNLAVSYDNGTRALAVPFQIIVASDAAARIQFVVQDEYSYWQEGRPNVSDASVTMVSVFGDARGSTTQWSRRSSWTGLAAFDDVTAGWYDVILSSPKHERLTRRLEVGPGDNGEVVVFLQRQAVQITWYVQPTRIEEVYDIVIDSTFEAHVPMPVVTVSPLKVDVGSMPCPGITQVDFTVWNRGKVAAEDFRFEWLTNVAELEAFEVFPFRQRLAAETSYTVPVMFQWTSCFARRRLSTSGSGGCGRGYGRADTPVGDFVSSVERLIALLGCNRATRGVTLQDVVEWGGGRSASPASSTPTSPSIDVSRWNGPSVSPQVIAVCGESTPPAARTLQSSCTTCASQLPTSGSACDRSTWWSHTLIKQVWEYASPKQHCADVLEAVLECVSTSCLDTPLQLQPDATTKLAFVNGTSQLAVAYDGLLALVVLPQYLAGARSVAFGGESARDEAAERAFDAALTRLTSVDSKEEELLSPTEIDAVVGNASMHYNNVSTSDLEHALRRYTNSLLLRRAGVHSTHDVPTDYGESNFYVQARVDTLAATSRAAEQQAFANGYAHLLEHFAALLAQEEAEAVTAIVNPQAGGCASVRVRLSQRAVLTRQAFEAVLTIDNVMSTPLHNISVAINWFRVEFGVQIKGSDEFFVGPAVTSDGWRQSGNAVGYIAGQAAGTAAWLLVPRSSAVGGTAPVEYFVTGELRYVDAGGAVRVALFPERIEVAPDPSLRLHYFKESLVFGDDPFTAEVVEPNIPFNLAVAVANVGNGSALNFRLECQRPQIVANENGLLLEFALLGTQVGSAKVLPSLVVDFGDIPAGSTRSARWIMTSTLNGQFKEFNASVRYRGLVAGGGGDELSLIDGVEVHDLAHMVDIYDGDNVDDYLVNDPSGSAPTAVYSSATVQPSPVYAVLLDRAPLYAPPSFVHTPAAWCWNVSAFTNGSSVVVEIHLCEGAFAHIAAPAWVYLRVAQPDIIVGQSLRVVRATAWSADGSRADLPRSNAWSTHRVAHRQVEDEVQSFVHLFDWLHRVEPKRYRLEYRLLAVQELRAEWVTATAAMLAWAPPAAEDGDDGSPPDAYNLVPNTTYSVEVASFDSATRGADLPPESTISFTTLLCALTSSECASGAVDEGACSCTVVQPSPAPSLPPSPSFPHDPPLLPPALIEPPGSPLVALPPSAVPTPTQPPPDNPPPCRPPVQPPRLPYASPRQPALMPLSLPPPSLPQPALPSACQSPSMSTDVRVQAVEGSEPQSLFPRGDPLSRRVNSTDDAVFDVRLEGLHSLGWSSAEFSTLHAYIQRFRWRKCGSGSCVDEAPLVHTPRATKRMLAATLQVVLRTTDAWIDRRDRVYLAFTGTDEDGSPHVQPLPSVAMSAEGLAFASCDAAPLASSSHRFLASCEATVSESAFPPPGGVDVLIGVDFRASELAHNHSYALNATNGGALPQLTLHAPPYWYSREMRSTHQTKAAWPLAAVLPAVATVVTAPTHPVYIGEPFEVLVYNSAEYIAPPVHAFAFKCSYSASVVEFVSHDVNPQYSGWSVTSTPGLITLRTSGSSRSPALDGFFWLFTLRFRFVSGVAACCEGVETDTTIRVQRNEGTGIGTNPVKMSDGSAGNGVAVVFDVRPAAHSGVSSSVHMAIRTPRDLGMVLLPDWADERAYTGPFFNEPIFTGEEVARGFRGLVLNDNDLHRLSLTDSLSEVNLTSCEQGTTSSSYLVLLHDGRCNVTIAPHARGVEPVSVVGVRDSSVGACFDPISRANTHCSAASTIRLVSPSSVSLQACCPGSPICHTLFVLASHSLNSQVDDSVLHRVSPSSCDSGHHPYQRTRVRVIADGLDVTSLAAGLSSSNTSVADFLPSSSSPPVVHGRAAGVANISLHRGSSIRHALSVSDQLVAVVSAIAHVVTQVTWMEQHFATPTAALNASLMLEAVFARRPAGTTRGHYGYLFLDVAFSDGHAEEVPAEETSVVSHSPSVIAVPVGGVDDHAGSASLAMYNLVEANEAGQWMVTLSRNAVSGCFELEAHVDRCGARLASAAAAVNVRLPAPVNVTCTVLATRLTPANDAAAYIPFGLPTSSEIVVRVDFDDGTHVDTYASEEGVVLYTDDASCATVSDARLQIAEGATCAFALARVNATIGGALFQAHDVVQVVWLTSVETSVQLYPPYAENEFSHTLVLYPLPCSAGHERAMLRTIGRLLDGTWREVTEAMTYASTNATVAVVDGGAGLTLVTALRAADGAAAFGASIDEYLRGVQWRRTTHVAVIGATVLVNITSPSRNLSASAWEGVPHTLSGVPNATWLSTLTLSYTRGSPPARVHLADVAAHSHDWFDAARIVQYSSDHPQIVRVDEHTGVLQLLDNHFAPITLRARVCPAAPHELLVHTFANLRAAPEDVDLSTGDALSTLSHETFGPFHLADASMPSLRLHVSVRPHDEYHFLRSAQLTVALPAGLTAVGASFTQAVAGGGSREHFDIATSAGVIDERTVGMTLVFTTDAAASGEVYFGYWQLAPPASSGFLGSVEVTIEEMQSALTPSCTDERATCMRTTAAPTRAIAGGGDVYVGDAASRRALASHAAARAGRPAWRVAPIARARGGRALLECAVAVYGDANGDCQLKGSDAVAILAMADKRAPFLDARNSDGSRVAVDPLAALPLSHWSKLQMNPQLNLVDHVVLADYRGASDFRLGAPDITIGDALHVQQARASLSVPECMRSLRHTPHAHYILVSAQATQFQKPFLHVSASCEPSLAPLPDLLVQMRLYVNDRTNPGVTTAAAPASSRAFVQLVLTGTSNADWSAGFAVANGTIVTRKDGDHFAAPSGFDQGEWGGLAAGAVQHSVALEAAYDGARDAFVVRLHPIDYGSSASSATYYIAVGAHIALPGAATSCADCNQAWLGLTLPPWGLPPSSAAWSVLPQGRTFDPVIGGAFSAVRSDPVRCEASHPPFAPSVPLAPPLHPRDSVQDVSLLAPPPPPPSHHDSVQAVSLLHEALANASVRHIMLPAGEYKLNSTLDIGRNVTIEAEAWGSAVLVGGGGESVLRITGGAVELIGLNVTGGNAQERRRLADGGHNVTIISVIKPSNARHKCPGYCSEGGGGVAILGGEVVMTSCNVYANLAANGGGLSISAGTVAMRDCVVYGNVAQLRTGGGGIFVHASFSGKVELLGCDVSGNLAASGFNNIVVRATLGSLAAPPSSPGYTVENADEDASTATTVTTSAIAVTVITSVASGIAATMAGSKVGLAITGSVTSEALAIGRASQGFSSTLILLSQVQSMKSLGLLSKELPPTLTHFSSTFSWGSMHFDLGVPLAAAARVPCDDVACREEAVLTGTALYLHNLGMSAEELFVNNVILDCAVLLCIAACHKALLLWLRRLNVASTEVVAFPKYELAWLLASYEGVALSAAILCKHADQQSTARTAALLSLVAVTAFGLTCTLVWLGSFIRANVHRLTQTGSLKFERSRSRMQLVRESSLSRTFSRETSTLSVRSFDLASPSPQKRPSSQSSFTTSTPRASSPWRHAHPPVDSGGLLCRLSHAMGKPPVLRHMASSAAWWDSFAAHEKDEMKTLSIQVAKSMTNYGDWRVCKAGSARNEREKANAFLSGYGELFATYNNARSHRLMPNYLWFVVEMGETIVKSVALVAVADPKAQEALVITLEAVTLALFLIQRPFIDKTMNVDVAVIKSLSLASFITLGVSADPSAAHAVIISNQVALYWLIALQVARQLHRILGITLKISDALSAITRCFADVCRRCRRGDLSPRKLGSKEGRSELRATMAPIGVEASKSVVTLVTSLRRASTLFDLKIEDSAEASVTREEALEKASAAHTGAEAAVPRVGLG
ncbi:hypothetical protein AB1Y20_000447 [Prymnesium parvum]|uniref:EGF-like domain-containing protein n=1 Tax=Prymnesium parvum TaxID=97485 RepID=A0AB34K9J1_PRYPA